LAVPKYDKSVLLRKCLPEVAFKVILGSNMHTKHWLEPPRSGGNAFGGIQNPLEFLGGNASPSPRLWRGLGQSFFKFRIVVLL